MFCVERIIWSRVCINKLFFFSAISPDEKIYMCNLLDEKRRIYNKKRHELDDQKHERTKDMMEMANLEKLESFKNDENIIKKYTLFSLDMCFMN